MAFVEMQTGGMRRIEVERIEGDRRGALVFLHEGLGSIAQWRDFPRAACAATGRAGLVYNRFGYGASDPIALPRPLTFMHDEALVLRDLLAAEQLDDVVIVGHSDGASIALLYAATRPRGLRGVVAIAPHVFVERICIESIAKIRREYDEGATDLRARLARYHGVNVDNAFLGWSGAWLDPEFVRWNIEGSLGAIDAPVLVVQGERDPYGTVAQVDAVARGVRGRVEALLLPGCGHAPHRERPDETLNGIARFVETLAPAAADAHIPTDKVPRTKT